MKKILVALLLLLTTPLAWSQVPSPGPTSILSGQVALNVSNVSARVALPSTSTNAITIYNKGAADTYVALGGVTVVATSGGTCVAGTAGPSCQVPTGTSVTLWRSGATYIAGITAASTSTLVIYQSNGPVNFQPSSSGTVSLGGSLPAGTNLVGKVGIDQTTPGTTNGVQVNAAIPAGTNNIGTVGGLEFNASVIPTVQNAAYAAGQALGGLQTISIGSTNGLAGILSQIQVASKGGSTVSVVAYVWQKNPASTTCTDKTNFVVSQTDNQHLIAQPQSISLATAVSAQDTSAYGSASGLAANFVNGSSNTNIYVCLLASAAVTPATTTDYRINIQGSKDAP